MARLAVLASVVLVACGGGGGGDDGPGIDAPISAACMEATTYSNLANIEDKIFKTSCIFSGCHNGAATDAGRIDLRAGMAHTALVGVPSQVEAGRTLVVAGDPAKSYLLVMIGAIAPENADPPTVAPPAAIGLMPQNSGGALLCQEKRDAVTRWIEMGAQNN